LRRNGVANGPVSGAGWFAAIAIATFRRNRGSTSMDGSVHIVCPHCDTINRVPRERLASGGRCGQCHQALFDGHPAALDTARFERHLAKSDVPLLVDSWAACCVPCKAMAPEFERAASTA